MRAKQIGKRRRVAAVRRRKPDGKRRVHPPKQRSGESLTPKQRWQLAQLVISGSLFVTLVAVTWFLPGGVKGLNETLSAAMERNIDVQQVFSAVGRAFAGESEGGASIYQAVFGSEELETVSPPQMVDLQNAAAWNTLRDARKETKASSQRENAPEQAAEVETLAYVLYSGQNLPENVSMEQEILGFDYCLPVSGSLSSGFGYREHPTQGDDRFHYGVDLAADAGTEILCFADGTVTVVGESSSYGKYCIVSHESGYRSLYAHCSRITAVSGTAVQEGQKIAEVGETGITTGPHLHFELQREGTYLNPIYYLGKR